MTTIGRIMGSEKQTFVAELKSEKSAGSRGKLIVRLDSSDMSTDEAIIKLSASLKPLTSCCCGAVNRPYFVISRAKDEYLTTSPEFVLVFRSETLRNANPVWAPIKLSLVQLCNGKRELPIKIEFFSETDKGPHKKYGEVNTKLEFLEEKKSYEVNSQGKPIGKMTLDTFAINEAPKLTDYVRSGWAINLALAIDFTLSNGQPSEPYSLHR